MIGSLTRGTAIFLTGFSLLVGCCLLPDPVLGEGEITVILEPGFPLKDSAWMVPIGLVDANGNPLDVPADDLNLTVSGTAIEAFDLGVFAPEPGGFPSTVAVLVDGEFPASGNEPLTGFLGSMNTAGRKGLFLCGAELEALQKFGAPAANQSRYDELLGRDEPGRLWDSILSALALLGEEKSARRVLLVVSSGTEELTSEHPLATCIEAAVRTRVAVHFVELPGNPAGAARLRELARKSGGMTTAFTGKASLNRAFSVIDSVQPLTIGAAGQPLPAEVAVSFGFSEKVNGTAVVAAPKALEGPSLLILAGLGLGVLAVGGGAFVLFRSVTRKSGLLVVDFQGKVLEIPIPRAGVTIGSDPDNVLVLGDPRIARHHAVVRERSAEVIITDLRSTHGTVVNGSPIRNASLRDGDRVILGKAAEITFRRQPRSKIDN